MSSTGWEAARELVRQAGAARPLAVESIPLDRADRRTLAVAVHALVDLPTADVSAMDGWVVAGDGPWRLDGAVAMGAPPARRLQAGTARVVTTGAAVPPGTVAVLRAEHGVPVPEHPDWLRAAAPSPASAPSSAPAPLAGRDIRRRGEELRRGEALIPVGVRMTPPRLALAAAAGHDTLDVLAHPRVQLIVTGDELIAAGRPAPGAVRDAFGPSLPALLERLGAATATRRIPDRLDPFIELLAEARPDVIVTTGGTAGGHGDLLRRAIVAEGGTIDFAGVAMRPGHPVLFARTSAGVPVLGLPGNPLAAFTCLLSFLPPWLDGASGRPIAALDEVRTHDLPATGSHRRLTPFTWVGGRAVASPWTGSAMLRGLADADGLLASPVAPGEPAGLLPLPW
ncbi:molybdopterin molybdotransferase MoeA [Agromyces cerinus]|uniref:Molybdopterin molybdenumtransferase n=1 Tax=Agromyces cerinus subsp. cerinus TaxID=232089 RepID=A0A1N6DMI1_9MICO|nr:molybdopterin-binding protein [Agromyces cerinus]SIN71927.1 molybdopterin molybdotransferase [Agromyces cerinus subsp. cerinus]